jgi:glycosyltransferase involved in cell wall biosynthesis
VAVVSVLWYCLVRMELHLRSKKKIDILMLSAAYPPDPGGVATHVYYLSQALSRLSRSEGGRRRRCVVHVVTGGEVRHREGVPPNLTVHWIPGGKQRHFASLGDVPFESAVQYLLRHWPQIRADVIHVHDFESLHVAMMIKAAFDVPIIMTIHRVPKDWDAGLPLRNTKDCAIEAIRKFELADVLIAPSRAYQRRLLDQGFRDDQVVVIPHGIPVKWLVSRGNIDGILAAFEIESDHRVILCPARLDPHKGIETFVDACADLKEEVEASRLLFVVAGAGTDAYRRQVSARVASLGVADAVRLGPRTGVDVEHQAMPTLYRRAEICVLPSRREGFGQVLIEAFAFRRPVIAANTGGIPDIVIPEVTGLLFNRDEPDDLAYQLRRMLTDSAFAEACARRGYLAASRDFNADRMAAQYFDLYSRCAGVRVS